MKKFKKITCFLFLCLGIINSNAQVINSGMSWLSTSPAFSSQSPMFNSTNCSNIQYQLSSSEEFKKVVNGSPYNNDCMIFPADLNSLSSYLDLNITFNQPISNLKIRFIDLDENVSGLTQPEESISQISPPASGVSILNSVTNGFYLVAGVVSPYDNNSSINNNDAAGWVNWSGDLTSVSFRYNRPKSLYALIIDSIYFECPSCVTNCSSVLEMPNVFSPNADGINDLFTPIVSSNIKNAKIIILNRWGNVIFNDSNIFSGWNGKSNGKDCTEGVYFWRVDYEDLNSSMHTQHGFFHLER